MPVGWPGHIAMVQHSKHLPVRCSEIFIGCIPLLAGLPARLRQAHQGVVPFRREGEYRVGSSGANVREAIRRKRTEDQFLLRHKADDGATSGGAGKFY